MRVGHRRIITTSCAWSGSAEPEHARATARRRSLSAAMCRNVSIMQACVCTLAKPRRMGGRLFYGSVVSLPESERLVKASIPHNDQWLLYRCWALLSEIK